MAMIPPFFLDSAVALGTRDSEGETSWRGSGFLVLRVVTEGTNGLGGHLFLVTNRHVAEGVPALVVRLNRKPGQSAMDFEMPSRLPGGQPAWHCHPDQDVDVAVAPLMGQVVEEKLARKPSCFLPNRNVLSREQMKEAMVSEGDEVYVLGYPMGLVAAERQHVIARSGCIARIRDLLEGASNDFLIDAFVFPGNSGGPVVLKPQVLAVQGTKTTGRASLLGIVSQYVPYRETAVSAQTGRPRISFEENSGLAVVVPADLVMETIEIAMADKESGAQEEQGEGSDQT